MITDQTVISRFLAKVDKLPNSCWLWVAVKNSDGYGNFKFEGTMAKAHRISYQIYIEDIPKGYCVLHSCDTPACVNPAHLFVGTQQDNANDREAKGRGHDKAGEANGRAILTAFEVKKIRRLYPEGKHTQRELGKLFGISRVVVSKIVRRELWKSVL